MKKRRRYSQEFKLEAVRRAREGGRTSAEVAMELGIRADMVRRWARELERDAEDAFRGSGRLRAEEDEVQRLKRRLTRVEQERDILKKAVAIFSGRRQ